MPSPLENFIQLIERIVREQMNEDQQTQFEIDGKEMIERLFAADDNENKEGLKNIPVLNISPLALDVINAATGFGALVVSSITLYIEIKKKKKKPLKERVEKLEYLKRLREALADHDMPPELYEAIEIKYGEELIDTLNDL